MKRFHLRLLAVCGLSIGLIGSAAIAQESSGVSLPVEGRMSVWDMRADPPVAIAENLPDGVVPGLCYERTGDKLMPQPGAACLDYYTSSRSLDELEQFSATGRLSFNGLQPDYALRGLELQGVEGIKDCGERDNCDVLYIAGFANAELTAQAMEAAREGRIVTVNGRKTWQAESVDMIVEAIEPAP